MEGRGLLRAVLAAVVMLLASAGVASAARLNYTVEYAGAYAYHEVSSSQGATLTTTESARWTYKATASVNPYNIPVTDTVLHGSLGLSGTYDLQDSAHPATDAHCTLSAATIARPLVTLTVGAYGVSPSAATDVPSTYVQFGDGPGCVGRPGDNGFVCNLEECGSNCGPSPPGDDPQNPVWSPIIEPTSFGERFGVSRQFDLAPSDQSASGTCYSGAGTDQKSLNITSTLSIGMNWPHTDFFLRFPDGVPPEITKPADLLQPTPSGPTPPKIGVPPTIPQPPTETPGSPPLVGGMLLQCPKAVPACPTTVTVQSAPGAATLARGRFSVPRGSGALMGLKLTRTAGARLRRAKRLRVRVQVAVNVPGGRTYRAARTATLTVL